MASSRHVQTSAYSTPAAPSPGRSASGDRGGVQIRSDRSGFWRPHMADGPAAPAVSRTARAAPLLHAAMWTDPSDSTGDFVRVKTIPVAVFQLVLVVGFAVMAFVLPSTVKFFKKHSVHVVLIHAGSSLLHIACSIYIHYVHQLALARGYLSFNHATSWIRHWTTAIVLFVNILLLALTSVEKWSEQSYDRSRLTDSAMLGVRILSVVEAVLCIIVGSVYIYRVRKHNVAQPMPEGVKFLKKDPPSLNGYEPPNVNPGAASPGQATSLQRANEVIAYLQQREEDLKYQVDTLQQQLDSALAPDGEGDPDRSALLRQQQRELADVIDENRALMNRCKAAEDEAAWNQQELRKANSELQRLRAALREEKRKCEKLTLTVEIEKEANNQAQRVIESIRNLDASDLSDPGARTSDYGSYSPPNPGSFLAAAYRERGSGSSVGSFPGPSAAGASGGRMRPPRH